MMKRWTILLLALVVFTGCVYDKYTPEECAYSDDVIYHLAFVLNSPAARFSDDTKASDDGLETSQIGSEILVKRVDLFFYTGGGLPQGKSQINRYTVTEFKQEASTPLTSENITNKVSDFAVALPFRPYVMLVAINLDDTQSDLLVGKTLAEVRELTVSGADAWAGTATSVKFNSTTYNDVTPFRMSSSTYLNAKGLEQCELTIPTSYIFETADEAKAHPIPVYIERLAAKVNVVQPDAGTSFKVPVVTKYEGITSKVTILGWGLNGLNKAAYGYKKINSAWSFDNWSIGWNESAKFRCHWAQDPNYMGSTAGTYPQNYGDFLAPTSLDPDACSLQYLSWNELTGNFSTSGSATRTLNPLYCLENTADGSILSTTRSDNQLYSRTTHVLIKAKLSFYQGTAFDTDPDGYLTETNFYRYRGVFYTINNILPTVVADQKSDGVVLYQDAAHTIEADASCFELTHLYGEMLYPKVKDAITLYDGSGNAVAKDVWKSVRVDGFYEGLFYYKIPIEHLEPAPSPLGAQYPTAQYGVVRNHNYIISIGEELKGIGTGIVDKDEPIVPVTEDRDYMVSVSVVVSNWKQFENRFVFVDPSGMLITNGQVVNRWEDEGDPSNNDWTGNGWYF